MEKENTNVSGQAVNVNPKDTNLDTDSPKENGVSPEGPVRCCDCRVKMDKPFKTFDDDHFCKDCCMPCDCKACGCDGACSNECDCICCSVEGYDEDEEDDE